MTTTTHHPGGRGAATLLAGLFAVYLVLLVWLVLWKLNLPWEAMPERRSLKLVPFIAAEGYGASALREVAGNVAVFVPFGLGLALLRPGWGWWRVAAAAAALSAALELAQFALAIGSTDVTDVITNTAGAVAGVVLARLFGRNPLAVADRSP
ncbi:VanZ family protein [Agromyces mediolanus]|uniref:VanZ family protein n=1 Tax=Agromyces mediolanus TaxID=41986 RepID=UPI003837DDA3